MLTIGAELAGYVVSISVLGRLIILANHNMSWLFGCLRLAAVLYIAYLAIGMWCAATALTRSRRAFIRRRTLFQATLLNPKGLLFAGTIFPASAFANVHNYILAIAEFTCLLVPIAFAWIVFGAALGRGYLSWVNPMNVQRGAAVALGIFSLSLAWGSFH